MNKDYNSRTTEFQKVIGCISYSRRYLKKAALEEGLSSVLDSLLELKRKKASLFVIGNGGSAAVASHIITDFTKFCSIPAKTLHEPSVFSCFANDYGYENAFARLVAIHGNPGDMLFAISSSGNSANMLNAAKAARDRQMHLVTLTGFDSENNLRTLGDTNFWLDSHDYGQVEIGHLFLLHYFSDQLGAMVALQPKDLNAKEHNAQF